MKPKTIVFLALFIACVCGSITYYLRSHHPSLLPSVNPGVVKLVPLQRAAFEKTKPISPPIAQAAPLYPWEESNPSSLPKITKEHFRCKGTPLNPPQIVHKEKETIRYYDCGGATKHSIPLRNGKESIYAIQIELLNYLQEKTGKRVVITSGHRCPEHNTYVDPSVENQYSKHMIGAEVSFYVQGLEEKPEVIVRLLQDYYKQQPGFEFERYQKETNVSTLPWFNKEVFIKLFKAHEGRNLDNRHPYPYISIQVRWDRETNEKVTYSWDKAFRNYLRY